MRTIRLALLATALATALAAAAQPHHAARPASTAVTSKVDVQHAADLVRDAIGSHRLVLLGEMHGTQEAPALAGAVLDRYAAQHRSAVLALEISTQEQPRFDRYIASHGTDADRAALLAGEHWRDAHHDGRDSEAMFALIEQTRQLHARGAGIALVAFDGGGADMNDRNRRMAEILRATAQRFPTSTLVVLTGNVHAMTRRPPWQMLEDGKPIEPPMSAGRLLADLHPLSIDVRGASGAYWACMDGGRCAEQPVGPAAMVPLVEARLKHDTSDDAWDDTLLLPRFTPSAPAISPQ